MDERQWKITCSPGVFSDSLLTLKVLFFSMLHVPFPDPSSKVPSMSTILFHLHLQEQKVEWASLGYAFCFVLVLECLGDYIAKSTSP